MGERQFQGFHSFAEGIVFIENFPVGKNVKYVVVLFATRGTVCVWGANIPPLVAFSNTSAPLTISRITSKELYDGQKKYTRELQDPMPCSLSRLS